MLIDRGLAVAGISIGLIGGGLLWLYPDKRWLGWSSVGLGVVIFVMAVVWTVAQKALLKEDQRQGQIGSRSVPAQRLTQNAPINNTNNNSPSFQNYFAPQVLATPVDRYQRQLQLEKDKPPKVEVLPGVLEEAGLDANGEITDRRESYYQGGELIRVLTAFAEFYRGADDSPASWIDLRGHVSFHQNGKLVCRIDEAAWWKGNDKYVSLKVGDFRRIVVAFLIDGNVISYAGKHVQVSTFPDIVDFEPASKLLEGKEFDVTVEVIGTKGGTTLLSHKVEYELSVDPPEFKLKKSI